MKISLCMPCFRRPEMLANCLDSILAQTHSDYEVVLKDGCIDHPETQNEEVWKRMIALGEKHLYVLSKDKGIFPALNEAMRYASGNILHFICSDDQLGDPDTLDAVNHTFELLDNSKPQWLYGITGGMDEHGVRSDHSSGAPYTFEQYIKQRGGIGQPAVFWNRAMYEAIGDFGTKYKHAADFAYWVRCWQEGEPAFIGKVLGIGRRWPESSSHIHADAVEKEAAAIQAWALKS